VRRRRKCGEKEGVGREGRRRDSKTKRWRKTCDICDLPSSFPVLTRLIIYSDYSVANAMRRLHTSDMLKHCTIISCLRCQREWSTEQSYVATHKYCSSMPSAWSTTYNICTVVQIIMYCN